MRTECWAVPDAAAATASCRQLLLDGRLQSPVSRLQHDARCRPAQHSTALVDQTGAGAVERAEHARSGIATALTVDDTRSAR
jgi:hypothetical protein